MWVSVAGWVGASVDEVVGRRAPEEGLSRWFPVLAAVDGHDPGDGLQVGAAGHAELAVGGGRDVPVRWRVVRRVRDTVQLEVVDAAGDRLEVRSSFSPWHGGTAVELGIEGRRLGGRRLRQRAVARALDRAIVAVQGRASGSALGRRRRLTALVPAVAELLPER